MNSISDTSITNNSPTDVHQRPPHQLIIFGPPGTGKSFKISGKLNGKYIDESYINIIGGEHKPHVINTVFHPETTYGDFVGRLLPISNGTGVSYAFHSGPLLDALVYAYKEQRSSNSDQGVRNVVLVIDELNRGNASSIFGGFFNLLDRAPSGESTYSLALSKMESALLWSSITDVSYGSYCSAMNSVDLKKGDEKSFGSYFESSLIKELDSEFRNKLQTLGLISPTGGISGEVRFPNNFYIYATINTSDDSIYYMDAAFKRRWHWEYMSRLGKIVSMENVSGLENYCNMLWSEKLCESLNTHIINNSNGVRNLDDKLFGIRFLELNARIGGRGLSKILFHLWDTIYQRDKRSLGEAISEKNLRTFDQLINGAQYFFSKALIT